MRRWNYAGFNVADPETFSQRGMVLVNSNMEDFDVWWNDEDIMPDDLTFMEYARALIIWDAAIMVAQKKCVAKCRNVQRRMKRQAKKQRGYKASRRIWMAAGASRCASEIKDGNK